MKYQSVKPRPTTTSTPRGSFYSWDEDLCYLPSLYVDDVLPQPTGLCDMHGNEIVKVHEWGFHQDNGT
jgi:hypothetical protein